MRRSATPCTLPLIERRSATGASSLLSMAAIAFRRIVARRHLRHAGRACAMRTSKPALTNRDRIDRFPLPVSGEYSSSVATRQSMAEVGATS